MASAAGLGAGWALVGLVVALRVYPVKSLDPLELVEARVARWGSLEYDRVYAIFDSRGRVVNGKREPRIHAVRARYDLGPGERLVVYASASYGSEEAFELPGEEARFSAWLSRVLGYDVEVRGRWDAGFPDDVDYNGPTLVSTATLATVASWMRGWDLLQARLRIRANIEVAGVPPFWEDRLNAYRGSPALVRVGEVVLEGWNISRRCAVPTRNPFNGVVDREFPRVLRERRPPIPGLDPGDRYRLAVNTRVPPEYRGRAIRLLDPVEVVRAG